MQTTITVRLTEKETEALRSLAEATGKSRSELVREALHAYEINCLMDRIRADLVPRAQAVGILTDEDVFLEMS